MSHITRVTTSPSNIAALDAFGRLRVSEPQTLFDSKQIQDNDSLFWDEALETGSGITSSYNQNRASTEITSTLSTAGKFTRQTFMSFNYQPGKSHLITMTGVIQKSGGGTGAQRRIGYFNDDNGLFFEDDNNVMGIVQRTNITGTPVDTRVVQTSWNTDTMDGSGPSGITVDWSKAQIFFIDFEWLGTGSVRYGVVLNGEFHVVHKTSNANLLDGVYMSTPNLPLRYQLETTAASPATSIECICSSVISEGGQEDTGKTRYVSTEGTHVDANTENTIYAIVGIRLKATNLNAVINVVKAGIQLQTGSENGEWTIRFNPTVAGTTTFNAVSDSAVEFFTGATANTVTGGTVMDGGFAGSEAAGAGSESIDVQLESSLRLGASIAGSPDEIYLCWMPTGGTDNHDVEGGITWREVK